MYFFFFFFNSIQSMTEHHAKVQGESIHGLWIRYTCCAHANISKAKNLYIVMIQSHHLISNCVRVSLIRDVLIIFRSVRIN